MEDLISKKDLLVETGISYGQLYRWKRKGLIPESWFIRRSTFTGQETFFPRSAILERVQWIQGAKNDAALDELVEQINNPGRGVEELPGPLLSRVSGITALALVDTVTRGEFLAWWILEQPGLEGIGRPVRDRLRALMAASRQDWLDHPETEIQLLSYEDGCFWIVAETPSRIHGETDPRVRIPVSEAWQRVKVMWQSAAREAMTREGIHG